MEFKVTEKDVKEFVKERFNKKFSPRLFNEVWRKYKELPSFKINENWFESIPEIKEYPYVKELHYVLRLVSQFYMIKTFEAMKIDLNDPNVWEDLNNGNIGTPGRIVKWFVGADTHDDRELLGGRFHEPVRLATFPNDNEKNLPIIKEVELTAVCSHHALPFSTKFNENAKVVIAYIPDKYLLGISKLQRLVRYVAQRGWLQEDLTKAIYNKIKEAAQTDSVYIKLKNIRHFCEWGRGVLSEGQGFTTEYYGGDFEANKELLEMVRNY